MWTCKIRINSEDTAVGSLCKEMEISALAYVISNARKDGKIYVNFMLLVFCDDEKRNNFFDKLKSRPRIVNLEVRGNYAVGEIEERSEADPVYHHKVFHVEPIKFSRDGYEIWSVAAWNKEELMDFADGLESKGAKLLKIKEEGISNLSVLTMHPELTDNQRRAIELAIEKNYYDIPRGIQLEELAEIMGISYSTYQCHLRKAEKKLLPFFFERN